MFLSLLFKEIRFHLLTFRFAAALITTLMLVVLSMWVLGDDYIRRRNTYNISVETTARQIEEVYVPSQISPTLYRPPSALSIFAQGEDRRFGNTLQVQRWEVPRRAEGSFQVGVYYEKRGKYRAALMYYEDLVARFPLSPYAEEAEERAARMREQLGLEADGGAVGADSGNDSASTDEAAE